MSQPHVLCLLLMGVPVSRYILVLKTYICEEGGGCWYMEVGGGIAQGGKVIEMPFDGRDPTKERQA